MTFREILIDTSWSNSSPMAFPVGQECRAVTCFSSLCASSSVCTSVKCVVSVGFFVLKTKAPPKPQTKPQQVDGNRVQERMEGVEAVTEGSTAPSSPSVTRKKRLINQSLIG